jgi:hypothetical protein
MNFRLRSLLACCAALVANPGLTVTAEAPRPGLSQLQLANGDYVAGRLVDSPEANVLYWQSDVASEPFQFPLSVVSAVHFPKQPPRDREAEYAIELTGGDMLPGELVGLSNDRLEVNSPRFGRLRIDRSQVRRIVRLDGARDVIYQGPNGMAEWKASEHDAWSEEASQLVADKPGAIVLADCPLPDRASIELELSWKRAADFSLSFGVSSELPAIVDGNGAVLAEETRIQFDEVNDQPSLAAFGLEVWNNSLVLVRERGDDADLALVQSLPSGHSGRLRLQVLYDRQTGHVAVYSIEGKLLGEVRLADESPLAIGGIRLENKRGDLRLEHLVVHRWTGKLPTAIDRDRPYLLKRDGKVTYPTTFAYDQATKEFVLGKDGGTAVRISAAAVASLSFTNWPAALYASSY